MEENKSEMVKENGYPKPLEKECFQCSSKILVKFVVPKKAYSKKNDWHHWTDKKENKDMYICDKCLIKLYNNDKLRYWELVSDPSKKQLIRTYINDGTIS